jgi:hypothetical protein
VPEERDGAGTTRVEPAEPLRGTAREPMPDVDGTTLVDELDLDGTTRDEPEVEGTALVEEPDREGTIRVEPEVDGTARVEELERDGTTCVDEPDRDGAARVALPDVVVCSCRDHVPIRRDGTTSTPPDRVVDPARVVVPVLDVAGGRVADAPGRT